MSKLQKYKTSTIDNLDDALRNIDEVDFTKKLNKELQLINNEAKKLPEKIKEQILKKYNSRCCLCAKRDGELSFWGVRKGSKLRYFQRWFLRKVELVFHKSCDDFVVMDSNCHWVYHFFQFLDDITLFGWEIECTLLRKKRLEGLL